VSLPPKDIALGANSDAVFETPIFLSPLEITLSITLFAVFSKFPLLKSSTKSTVVFPIT
jgi:hypothetical protein